MGTAPLLLGTTPEEQDRGRTTTRWCSTSQCYLAPNLGVEDLQITPHVFRDSGPSDDWALKLRPLDEVRWLGANSVRRCEKSARLSSLVAHLSPGVLANIFRATSRVTKCLLHPRSTMTSVLTVTVRQLRTLVISVASCSSINL